MKQVNIRLSEDEVYRLGLHASRSGFRSMSGLVRELVRRALYDDVSHVRQSDMAAYDAQVKADIGVASQCDKSIESCRTE